MIEQDNGPSEPLSDETSEDVYRLIPPDPNADAAHFDEPVLPEIVPEEDPSESTDAEKPRLQFTLRDLLLVVIGVAVWLSAMSVLSWSWSILAGVAGVAVFVSLVFLSTNEPENPSVRFAWWCVFVIYLMTCLAAIVIGT